MKSNTQNAKIEAITEKTLVLGIDVGSEMHYARAFDYRGIEYSKKPFKFSNTEAGFATFKEWIRDLKERHEKDKVVPGMEPTGHYWFNLGKFLQDNEMKPVLVNPHHVKKSKELDDNNPTKNDRKDPKVIAGLVREGRYMIPYLPDGVYADLRTASNIRFQLQAELTRIQNRISRWFNIYFPEYKTVYGKPDAKSGMLILKAAPDVRYRRGEPNLAGCEVKSSWKGEGEDPDRSCRAQRWKQRRCGVCKNGNPNAFGGL